LPPFYVLVRYTSVASVVVKTHEDTALNFARADLAMVLRSLLEVVGYLIGSDGLKSILGDVMASGNTEQQQI
jgi:hypothetical protein